MRLNSIPTHSRAPVNLIADSIATQLVKYGKMSPRHETNISRTVDSEKTELSAPFTMEKPNNAIKKCKLQEGA